MAKYEEVKRRADIVIGKQRNGPPGDFRLVFLEEITRFEDLTKEPIIGGPSQYQRDVTEF